MEMDCNSVTYFLMFLAKSPEKLTMVCSSFVKIIRFLSLEVLGVFCVREKIS